MSTLVSPLSARFRIARGTASCHQPASACHKRR